MCAHAPSTGAARSLCFPSPPPAFCNAHHVPPASSTPEPTPVSVAAPIESAFSFLHTLANHALASETAPGCEAAQLSARANQHAKRKRPHSSEDDDSSTANEVELDDEFTDDLSDEEFASPSKRAKLSPKTASSSESVQTASDLLATSTHALDRSSGSLHSMMADAIDMSTRRGHLPDRAIRHLKGWFYAHRTHPYPSEDEKNVLMEYTGLSKGQINNWFTNARRRLLPKLESR